MGGKGKKKSKEDDDYDEQVYSRALTIEDLKKFQKNIFFLGLGLVFVIILVIVYSFYRIKEDLNDFKEEMNTFINFTKTNLNTLISKVHMRMDYDKISYFSINITYNAENNKTNGGRGGLVQYENDVYILTNKHVITNKQNKIITKTLKIENADKSYRIEPLNTYLLCKNSNVDFIMLRVKVIGKPKYDIPELSNFESWLGLKTFGIVNTEYGQVLIQGRSYEKRKLCTVITTHNGFPGYSGSNLYHNDKVIAVYGGTQIVRHGTSGIEYTEEFSKGSYEEDYTKLSSYLYKGLFNTILASNSTISNSTRISFQTEAENNLETYIRELTQTLTTKLSNPYSAAVDLSCVLELGLVKYDAL